MEILGGSILATSPDDYDRRVILKIAEQALAGNWETAAREARELLKAQSQTAK